MKIMQLTYQYLNEDTRIISLRLQICFSVLPAYTEAAISKPVQLFPSLPLPYLISVNFFEITPSPAIIL